jgi:hypothetical protein
MRRSRKVTRDSVLAREGQTHAIAGASESSPPAAFWFTKKLRSSSLSLCDPETAARTLFLDYALRYSHALRHPCSFGHAPARRERFVTDQATYQLAAWRDPAGRSPPPPAPRGPPELRRTLKDLRTPAQLLVLRVHPCTIDTSSDSDPRARCAGLRVVLHSTAQPSSRCVDQPAKGRSAPT